MPASGSGSAMEHIINRKAAKWKLSGPTERSRSSRAYNTAMQDIKLIVVQTYGSRPEADLAKGALEDAGIRSMIQADTAGGMREHLAWSGAGFRVLVREEDATVARDVLTPSVQSDESADADCP
ncbi:MAG: hypothetical protein DMG56_15830 [Acidobacteria bacterium]|nr:MAG: hypothetical protein DMG56_15830 [Acidobacteriota bacterium]